MSGPSKLYITNPEVNSGTNILVYAKSVNTTIEVFTNVEDVPHTNPAATKANRLAKGRNTGYKNPIHTVQGVITLGTTHTTGADAILDFEYVIDLINRSDQIMTLTCDKWATTDNPAGALTVMLKSYSDSNNNDSTISFSMTFQEVYNG